MFFVDEVGDNTLQKNDGNVGGQKFVIGEIDRALICASYADKPFTVLGFTSSDGNPVCCVIILAGSELKANHIMRIQPLVEVDGDVLDVHRNSGGLHKYYPCGPKCTHLGCEIDIYMEKFQRVDQLIRKFNHILLSKNTSYSEKSQNVTYLPR